MTNNRSLEVETKFLLPDLGKVRRRLLAVEAILTKPRIFESNIRLDTADEALLQRWQLLRLRQDTAVRLTFKGPTPEDAQSEAKVREELEIEVSDFATALAIFRRLGFVETQVYEKYRETFHLGAVEVVLDELPFGDFVELEGDEEGIKTAVAALNLPWDRRIDANYLQMMGEIKAFHHLSFNDLTFANFAGRGLSMADLRQYQYAYDD